MEEVRRKKIVTTTRLSVLCDTHSDSHLLTTHTSSHGMPFAIAIAFHLSANKPILNSYTQHNTIQYKTQHEISNHYQKMFVIINLKILRFKIRVIIPQSLESFTAVLEFHMYLPHILIFMFYAPHIYRIMVIYTDYRAQIITALQYNVHL